MAADRFFVGSACALSAFTNPKGSKLMVLAALSCQWSRARLCACAVVSFHRDEARQRSLPSLPPLSPLSLRLGKKKKVWCIGGDRAAARTRSGVERQLSLVHLWPSEE